MDEPKLTPPFQRHQQTAENLLEMVRDALSPTLEARGFLTREDIERVMGRLTAMTDRTALLFAQNCRTCVAHPVAPAIRMAMLDPRDRRRDFVTRLLFSHIVDQLSVRIDPLTGAAFPRLLATPFQMAVSGLFYEIEWRALNIDAATAFERIGTADDASIRKKIDEDSALPIVVGSIFVRVLLRFRQFSFQRQRFIQRMAELLRGGRFVFTEEHFTAIFDALAGRMRPEMSGELARARADLRYGEGTSALLCRILDEFEQYRRTVAERAAAPVCRPLGMSRRLLAASR